jgi:hypothetical protein
MNNKRYVARSNAIAARVLGDETMIMSATNSTLFTLNDVATVLWESADGATPLEEIVANKICEQYDVTFEVALEDAEVLVAELVGHGLLAVSEEPIGQAATVATEASWAA